MFSLGVVMRKIFMAKTGRILAGNQANDNLQAFMEQVGRFQLCVLGLLLVGFVSVGQVFVCLWNEPAGVGILYPCIVMMLVPGLLRMVQDTGTAALIVSGDIRSYSLLQLAMAVVAIVVLVLSAAQLGAVSAGVAFLVSGLLRVAGQQAILHKRFRVNVKSLVANTVGRWILPAAVVSVAFYALSHALPWDSWGVLAAEACAIAFVHSVGMAVFVLQPEDKALIRRCLPGRSA